MCVCVRMCVCVCTCIYICDLGMHIMCVHAFCSAAMLFTMCMGVCSGLFVHI